MPGDLHKLWRTRDPKGYHVEYGYSCMGYEIAGGLGVKLAAPEREVYVLVGDGSYLMLSSELVTAVQEDVKLIVVLVDSHGFNSIGALSRSLGLDGFGTQLRFAGNGAPVLDGDTAPPEQLPVDLAANAASLGVETAAGRVDRGSPRGARAGEAGDEDHGDRRRGRPLRGRPRLRELVGRAGRGDLGATGGAAGAGRVRGCATGRATAVVGHGAWHRDAGPRHAPAERPIRPRCRPSRSICRRIIAHAGAPHPER